MPEGGKEYLKKHEPNPMKSGGKNLSKPRVDTSGMAKRGVTERATRDHKSGGKLKK